jgi:transposase InsO family protein
MTDNGSAMISGEFTAGLHHLGILHLPTLPYSPHVNGKQENIWGRVEGRLLAMLEGESQPHARATEPRHPGLDHPGISPHRAQ